MTGKEPVDHILRPRLPWRDLADAPLTECGFNAEKLPTITREAYFARRREMGQQRCALFTCMTCATTAERWGSWDDDPRLALGREIEWERGGAYWRSRTDRGERLRDELMAIAALIAAHDVEFAGLLLEIGQRRAWNAQLEERRKRPKPPPERGL